jgi:S-adenosylmethionine synthetase
MISSPRFCSAESVSAGNADKVADAIADAIVDACLKENRYARASVNAMVTKNQVVVGGVVSGVTNINYGAAITESIRASGYGGYKNVPPGVFEDTTIFQNNLIRHQILGISERLDDDRGEHTDEACSVLGYACQESKNFLPLPLVLAHTITREIAIARSAENPKWLRPDAEAKVTVRYEGGVPVEVTKAIVFLQHTQEVKTETIEKWVNNHLLPKAMGTWFRNGIDVSINPLGRFICGGPEWNCGISGRRLNTDTYCGFSSAPATVLSGQDATRLARSATYFARWIARQIVSNNIATEAEVRICYASGIAQPVSLDVDTRGTGNNALAVKFAKQYDGRLGSIIERFKLRQPIYFKTAIHGPFSENNFPWET